MSIRSNRLLPKSVVVFLPWQIACPNIVLDLPLPVLLFPDSDILADIEYSLLVIEKAILTHFIDGSSQTIDFEWGALHGPDTHIDATLPEGLDRCPPVDRRGYRMATALFRIERHHARRVAVAGESGDQRLLSGQQHPRQS